MQNFKQKIQQKLFPQQIHLMKLIELPTLAFEERLYQELEDNPFLAIDKKKSSERENIYDFLFKNHKNENKIYINKKQNSNIYEYLRYQLCNFKLTYEEFIVTDFILGNLDEEGYLRRNTNELINDINFGIDQKVNKSKIEKLVDIVKQLDPPGIGSKDLKECLLLQLKQKPISPEILIAKLIINDNFDLLCNKQYKKIKENLKLNYQELHSAVNEIKRLNPKPGKFFDEVSTFDTIQIIPDFFLCIKEGILDVYLNKRNTKSLCITPFYVKILQRLKKSSFSKIKKKIDKAKWFIDAVNQRKKTLLFTMKSILNLQKEFFFSGEKQKIRPMTLQKIANFLKMEISTISRVINRKYVETPYGNMKIKDLFSEKIFHTYREEVSNIEVKYILSNFIKKENSASPFTDEKISSILKGKGYNIARRTITKYREQLNIPIARLRKIIEYSPL